MATVIKASSRMQRQANGAWLCLLSPWVLGALGLWGLTDLPHAPVWAWGLPLALLLLGPAVYHPCMIIIRGHRGERKVFGTLKRLPADHCLFNGLHLHAGGHGAQIDHLVVAPSGVWCVETKAHLGTIHGSEADERWTQVKRTKRGRKYTKSFHNPVAQNAGHCRCLRGHLRRTTGREWPIHSVIVFTAADLQVTTTTPVIPLRDLLPTLDAHRRPVLSTGEMAQIVEALGR